MSENGHLSVANFGNHALKYSCCLFSLAECACKDGYLPRLDENSNIVECIEEHTQGHCNDGQKYSWNLDSEEPMCLREDCSTIKDMTKGCEQEGYLPYFDENGKQQCYEEFSQVTFNPIRTGVFLGQSVR